jgi:GDP-4-dehydro-6-deoxy-D-mannose reductase
MQESLNILIKISGIEVEVETDPGLMRLSDEKVLLGIPRKLNELGWKPEIPFEQTLEDIYLNWLQRLTE